MEASRKVLPWITLIALLCVAALELNSSVYSFWIAGGPPNNNSEGWLFAAWTHLQRAGAALVGGFGIFFLLRTERFRAWSVTAVGLAAFLLLLPPIRTHMAADDCLDKGGSWSKKELRCSV